VALTGEWRINAIVIEDSISSGLSPSYNQVNQYNPAGTVSSTGSPSWYIGIGNPITSGALFSHMYVVRAILCPGANIWGETSFINPSAGTTVTKSYNYSVPAGTLLSRLKVIGFVEKYGSTTSDRPVENVVQVNAPLATSFYFAAAPTQTKIVCQNSLSNNLDTMLGVFDQYSGESINWNLLSTPVHGSASVAFSSVSIAGVLYPSGLSYTPTVGYTGLDSFKVRVTNGTMADTTTIIIDVKQSPTIITGSLSVCVSATTSLSSTPVGGTWSSGTTSIATIGTTTGILAGVSAGTSEITYKLPSGCKTTTVITVNPLPNAGAIIGFDSVCVGSIITLTDTGSVGVGTWTNFHPSISNITSAGVVSGISAGIDTIKYSATNVCGTASTIKPITVKPLPYAGAITGPTSVCNGYYITLVNTVASGLWAVSNPNATVLAGVVTGVVEGIDTVWYIVSNSCGSDTASLSVTINPYAGVITGPDTVCVGSSIILSASIPGGIWSSMTGLASVNSAGLVTGISGGSELINYSVSNVCGIANTQKPVFVCGGTSTVLNDIQNNIKINPNPSQGVFSFSSADEIGTIIILNMLGEVVFEKKYSDTTAIINIANLPNGMYVLVLNSCNVYRIIKN
jgi:hypothetical protein